MPSDNEFVDHRQRFDSRLCQQKQEDCDRRMTSLEDCISHINAKLEEFGQRLPNWAMFLISGLSTACGSLIMWIITRK